MKAKFFLLGLCALALAACSIDEVSQVNDTNAVTFKATTATRAAAVTTNSLQEFTVWAWNGTNEFMDGVTASKSGSVFTTSPLYFWPTGSVDFYALTEVVEHGIFTGADSQQHEYALLGGEITESGDGWTYTGNVAKAQVDNGTIVIDACIPSTPEEQIDICYGVALEKSSGSVPMNFRHALSQVAFKAKNVNTAFDVKIADVSVCSVYSEGTYTIGKYDTSTHLDEGTSTDPATGTQGEWTIIEKDEYDTPIKSRYLVNMEDSIVQLDTEGTAVELVDPEGVLMLLPQEVVGWDPLTDAHDGNLGAYIRILCHVEESGSQLWPNNVEEEYEGNDANFKEIGGEEYAEIAIPLEDVEWEQGYRYTYTIIFGEGLGYYPPDDPNYDLDGTPVLVPITFNVTVDEFQDAEGVDVQTDTDLSYIAVSTQAQLLGAIHSGYQEICVAENIELTTYLEFTQDCILDIADGVTLTAPNSTEKDDDAYILGTSNCYSAAIYVTGGTLTINGPGTVATTGGSESAYTEGIWVAGGTVIINSGTFKGGSWNADPDSVTGSESAVYVDPGAAYIYGGTFTSGNFRNGEHWAINCGNSSYKEGNAMIYCYGGTYTDGFNPADPQTDDAPSYVAEGYGVTYDSSANSYTVVYTTVATPTDLYAAVEAGASEITLDADITLEKHDLYFTEDCVLDLNGHTLTGVDVADDEDCSIANSVVFVYGGTLTVNGPGTITTEGSGKGADGSGTGSGDTSIFWLNGGDLIINGGTYNGGSWKDTTGSDYTDSSATVYVQSGFAYIYDGTFTCGVAAAFKSDGWKTAEGYTESIINIYDSARNTEPKTGWAYVYGGTYRNFDPGNNPCEGANTNFCVTGYASDEGVVDADGNTWFTVTKQ